MTEKHRKKLLSFFLIILLVLFSVNIVSAQKKELTETKEIKSLDKQLNALKEGLETIEKNKLAIESNQAEHIKQALSISSDTVKYVGTVATILLPLIIFLIGYQVIRSWQFEREKRDTRKVMIDEYQEMLSIRSESEKLISETRSKMINLEDFVGNLATDFLRKTTPNLLSEVKEQVNHVMAEIKTKNEEVNRSIELMKKLETLDLTLTPSIYLERGAIYLDQNNPEKSIKNFDKAIELKPDNFDAYFKRGRAYHRMLKYDEAIKDYMKAAEINPKEAASYLNIGLCYRAKQPNDYDKSIKNITKAIELNPEWQLTYLQRGITYAKMKEYDLAVNDLKKAESLNPNSIEFLNSTGYAYGLMGRFDLSVEYYLKAIVKNKTLSTMLNLTEAYICKKDFINAEKMANESYSIANEMRDKIMSKFLLVTALILDNKDYKIELKSIFEIFKASPDFKIEDWSFDELLGCLTDSSIQEEKTNFIKKLIVLLKKEIKLEDFILT